MRGRLLYIPNPRGTFPELDLADSPWILDRFHIKCGVDLPRITLQLRRTSNLTPNYKPIKD
jgi:hypothetical protein